MYYCEIKSPISRQCLNHGNEEDDDDDDNDDVDDDNEDGNDNYDDYDNIPLTYVTDVQFYICFLVSVN